MFTVLRAAVIVLVFAVSSRAEQIPVSPPADWAVSIRFYGTTEQLGHDSHRTFIYKSGIVPARISVTRPRYRDDGTTAPDSQQYEKKLSKEAALGMYNAARSMVVNFQVAVSTPEKIKDGTSVEVSVRSADKKIAVVLDHSSYSGSSDFKNLMDIVNLELPDEFRIR